MVIDQGESLSIARDSLIKIEQDMHKEQNFGELVKYFRDTIGPCEIVAKALSEEETSRSAVNGSISTWDKWKAWFFVCIQFLVPFGIFLQDIVTDSLLAKQ